MAPGLSSGTLGLKFMQRGAAAKAAAAAQVAQKDQEDSQKHSVNKKQKQQARIQEKHVKREQSSTEDESEGSSDAEDNRDQHMPPVASTSNSLSRPRSAITTESSYLAFPILSRAYGNTTATSKLETRDSVNGRLTFGQVAKQVNGKGKGKETETDSEENDDDSSSEPPTSRTKQKNDTRSNGKQVSRRNLSGNVKGSSTHTQQSIREQQRGNKQKKEVLREKDPSSEPNSSSEDMEQQLVKPKVKYEEDKAFVDDMINQARQKRQSDASLQQGRKRRK